MKVLYAINILITIVLWVSASYFITWHKALLEEFFRVGWENYEGTSLKTPEIYFSRLVMLGAAFAFYTGIQTYRKHEWTRLGVVLCIVAGMSLFLGMVILGGGINISIRDAWTWQTLFTFNLILSAVAFVKLEYKKPLPLVSNDILDDPNSITHHES